MGRAAIPSRRPPNKSRSIRGASRLAVRAPEGDAVALVEAADWCSAAAAWAVGAAVDPGSLASAAYAGGCLAGAFGVGLQQAVGEVDQVLQAVDLADRAPGVHAAQEQDLGPVDVPDSGEPGLVEKGL